MVEEVAEAAAEGGKAARAIKSEGEVGKVRGAGKSEGRSRCVQKKKMTYSRYGKKVLRVIEFYWHGVHVRSGRVTRVNAERVTWFSRSWFPRSGGLTIEIAFSSKRAVRLTSA